MLTPEIVQNTLEECLKLQNNLNKQILGEDWADRLSYVDWLIAVNDEIAELMNSLPWKWWKHNSQVDIENIKLELVDIFHFLLSYYITVSKETTVSDKLVNSVWYHLLNDTRLDEEDLQDRKVIRSLFLNLMQLIFYPVVFSSAEMKWLSTDRVIEQFVQIVNCFMSWEELIKLYIGKNALNQIRRDFGYKDGNYQKVWNGREDNEVMMKILNGMSIEEITFEVVYQRLKDHYTKVIINDNKTDSQK